MKPILLKLSGRASDLADVEPLIALFLSPYSPGTRDSPVSIVIRRRPVEAVCTRKNRRSAKSHLICVDRMGKILKDEKFNDSRCPRLVIWCRKTRIFQLQDQSLTAARRWTESCFSQRTDRWGIAKVDPKRLTSDRKQQR